MTWDIVAASATGFGHARQGLPCQDAFDHSRTGQWFVAVVCDGAGSASQSDIGAEYAARTIVRELVLVLDMAPGQRHGSESFWEKAVVASIGSARALLREEKAGLPADLADYHATVVGAVVGPEYGLFFHIGDGAAFAFNQKDGAADCIVSAPENGEYADQTYFFTMDNWRDHLRLTFFDDVRDTIALMSDGAMSFAAARGGQGPDPGFMGPVLRYLDQVDEHTGSKALENTLASERTHAITSDDKTVLIALKRS